MHKFALLYLLSLFCITNFDILLTVRLTIILVIDQLSAQICALSCLITKIILKCTVSKTSNCGQLFYVKGKIYLCSPRKHMVDLWQSSTYF